ncbi:hypothetical protein [Streptomyces sp. KL116D]|uniref:hypothetical protein n=1 Tax=Streptomyces sp. KL116D TaxID=3045152 RepID=UPI0035576647
MTSPAARTAAAWAALMISHDFGDHVVQIDAQAVTKGKSGAEGIRACATHVATYTATQAITLAAANRLLDLRISWKRAAAGLAISAATHYIADRQGGHWCDDEPRGIVRLAAATGHAGWLQRDPNAGYLMDQSWHKAWLAVAAAVIGGGER